MWSVIFKKIKKTLDTRRALCWNMSNRSIITLNSLILNRIGLFLWKIMFGKRSYQSPEIILSKRQSRDRKLATGRCDGCINLKKMGDIPYCSKDNRFFSNRFNSNNPRCKDFLHTRWSKAHLAIVRKDKVAALGRHTPFMGCLRVIVRMSIA